MSIPTIPFGSTGHRSTRCIFGGAALSRASQEEADRTLAVLLQYGINHIDTAAGYGDSELRIAPWMRNHRDRFFLATKTGERGAGGARAQLERSLQRLQVDHVDLIQLHGLTEPDEWRQALGSGGALEALIRAREEGLARNIGITGHGVTVARSHLDALERHPFDAVLLPLNYPMFRIPEYAADFEELHQECRRRGVAVQTIKAIARRRWTGSARPHSTWYEPLAAQQDIDAAVHWVLAHDGVFLNTAGDMSLLPRVLDAAARFPAAGAGNHATAAGEAAARRQMQPLFTAAQNVI
ncbi:MAG: aldo/keto reductase [Spirochaetaceae bacterium]|nr:aldo/keto reductase [Spirochaetaceae bacterium]